MGAGWILGVDYTERIWPVSGQPTVSAVLRNRGLYREDLAVSGQRNEKQRPVTFRLYREDLAVSGQQPITFIQQSTRLYREDLAVSGQLKFISKKILT